MPVGAHMSELAFHLRKKNKEVHIRCCVTGGGLEIDDIIVGQYSALPTKETYENLQILSQTFSQGH